MSNRTTVILAITIVMLFVALVAFGQWWRNEPQRQTLVEATSDTAPILPVPSTPDTAAPIITTTPPDTTAPTTTKPRPRPTTTTAPVDPEPEVQGEAVVDGDDVETWLAIGRCEQPGNEWGGVRWSHPGPTYQGGLGFWYGTWDSFKQGTSAEQIDNAGQATPQQQMEVARNIRDRYGYRAWGCGKKLGLR